MGTEGGSQKAMGRGASIGKRTRAGSPSAGPRYARPGGGVGGRVKNYPSFLRTLEESEQQQHNIWIFIIRIVVQNGTRLGEGAGADFLSEKTSHEFLKESLDLIKSRLSWPIAIMRLMKR